MRSNSTSGHGLRRVASASAVLALAGVMGGAQAATWCVPASTTGCTNVVATIQGAIDAAAAGDTIRVAAGQYAEGPLKFSKSLTLLGAQADVDARGRTGVPGTESVILPTPGMEDAFLVVINEGASGAIVNGFTLSGRGGSIQVGSPDVGNIDLVQILNNRFLDFEGGAMWFAASGTDVTIRQNLFDGAAQTLQSPLLGLPLDKRFDGFWLINNEFVRGTQRTIGFLAAGYRQISRSTRPPTIVGNTFHHLFAGLVVGNAVEYAEISNNEFRNIRCVSLQAAPAYTLIAGNRFIDNGAGGIGLGLPLPSPAPPNPEEWGAHHNTVTGNLFIGNGNVLPLVCGGQAISFATGQAPGTITTNAVHGNAFVGNNVGAWYEGEEAIDITGNYWGAASGPYHRVRNPDGDGDLVMDQQVFPPGNGPGRLLFAPWLETSPVLLPSARTWCVPTLAAGCDLTRVTIQSAVNAAWPGDTIKVAEGVFNEGAVWITKAVRLLGVRAGSDARGRTGPESVITTTASPMPIIVLGVGAAGTVIDGFTIQGGNLGIQTSGPETSVDRLQILNNRFVGFTGSGIGLGAPGIDVTIDRNFLDGTSRIPPPGWLVGLMGDVPRHGFWLTNNEIINGHHETSGIGFQADGSRNMGASATRTPRIQGNLFAGNFGGVVMGLAMEDGEISDNRFVGNDHGMNAKPSRTTIARNLFEGNTGFGLSLGDSTDLLSDNTITDNDFVGNGGSGLQGRVKSTLIAGNSFANNGGLGINLLGGATDNTITDNTFVGNLGGGLAAAPLAGTLLARNIVRSNGVGGPAISVGTGGTNNTIIDNELRDNLGDGIRGGLYQSLLSRNIIEGNRGFALTLFSAARDNTVTANLLLGNGRFDECNVAASPTGCGGGINLGTLSAIELANDITGNTISGNVVGAVYYGSNATQVRDLRSNDWGTASGPYHATRNPTGTGNAVVDQSSTTPPSGPGMILFDPWIGIGYTPAGANVDVDVTVALPGGSTAWVGVGFEEVMNAGRTSVTTSDQGPTPPIGFQLGKPPVYYDVATTATFSGNVEVCFTWAEGQFHNEKMIRLQHYATDAWVDVTTTVDTTENVACGRVTSLSPFALMEVAYAFTGFNQPIANPPAVNTVKAGQSVSVKFGLGGYRGLDIFDPGYPKSGVIDCANPGAPRALDSTALAGTSVLQYESATDAYIYVWKTLPAWAKTCRALVVNFLDGSQRMAYFQFRQ